MNRLLNQAAAATIGSMMSCAPAAWSQPVTPAAQRGETLRAGSKTQPVPVALSPTAWSHAGRDGSRVSAVDRSDQPNPPPFWAQWPTFTINSLTDGTPIDFMTQTTPVVRGTSAYALAWVGGFESLVAIDLPTGSVLWIAELPIREVDSWSSPAIDAEHRTVLVGMGDEVTAFSAPSGRERWRTPLLAPVVNASPVITNDLGPRDRAFVTDYGFFSDAGRLYCLNTDPFDQALNPFQPGQIVWSVVIDSVSSGNSPAYLNGTVYVATPGDGFGGGGKVLAFDATTDSAPSPTWVFQNPVARGFYGGVSVRSGAVYAASYGFSGTQLNSNLVKLIAQTGALAWSVPSNRSSSTPVPLADGRVVLSGGILPDPVFGDYGSRPSVAVYQPNGSRSLETALDTWADTDDDGSLDVGESLLVGGWTGQPLVIESTNGNAEAIVAISPAVSVPNLGGDGLARLNLDWTPTSGSSLVLQASPLGGGSAATSGGWLVSLGEDGLTIWPPRWNGGAP